MYSYMILIHGVVHYICLFAEILVAPANRTVPVNTTTNFFCRARGDNLRWFINGTLADLTFNRQMYADIGIKFDETLEPDSDDRGIHTFNATITVNASVAINTTTFTCVVSVNLIHYRSSSQLIVMGKYIRTMIIYRDT